MKIRLTIICLLAICSLFGQTQKLGLVLDQTSKKPIEFVAVYTNDDHTLTNSEGKYFVNTFADSISFSLIGYEKIQLSTAQIPDTVYLKSKTFELEGVTVSNLKTLWQKMKDSLFQNYRFEPYQEEFFLRSTLKQDGTLVRLQDIAGNLKRKTLLYTGNLEHTNKDYEIQINQMRKVGVVKDTHNIYFKFPTFFGILSTFARLNVSQGPFNFKAIPFENGAKIRYEFESKNKDTLAVNGYYIFNMDNHAMEKFVLDQKINLANNRVPFAQHKWLRYRTQEHYVEVIFSKKSNNKPYSIDRAKFRQVVLCTDEERTFETNYESEFILTNHNPFNSLPFKKNANATKDIFKLKKPYDPNFWNKQRTLLLTTEMENFILKMGSEAKEFKVKSNF